MNQDPQIYAFCDKHPSTELWKTDQNVTTPFITLANSHTHTLPALLGLAVWSAFLEQILLIM